VVLKSCPGGDKEVHHFWDNGRGRVLSEGEIKVSDKITLRRVALVQSLGYNFLSVSQLLDGVQFPFWARWFSDFGLSRGPCLYGRSRGSAVSC
jgi:hypothetical protein